MPQLQNLVLTDRATTPVNHTFTPRDIVDGVATVVETTGVPVGEKRVSISLRRTAGKVKGRLVLTFPVVQNETVNGIVRPTVVRTAIADVNVTFDATSTEQERKDLIGQLESALGSSKTLVNDTFVSLQNVY
jgi:hypothetical protein